MTVSMSDATRTQGPMDARVAVVVHVDPELDIATLPELREELARAVDTGTRRVIVDLSDCRFLDAQAIRVLLDVHRRLWIRDGRLVLRGCSPAAMRLLALAGVLNVFDTEPLHRSRTCA
jgi:anti-anti-sigma factor